MPEDRQSLIALAAQVAAALGSADLAGFEDLLDLDVRWGAPDDDDGGCENRKQVVAWYLRGRDAGVRASVTEVVVGDDSLLVGLRVSGRAEAEQTGGEESRWQVLTVAGGRVVDIRGLDDRAAAARRCGADQ